MGRGFYWQVPRTVANFKALATTGAPDRKGRVKTYAGCVFHRVIPRFMLQTGDILFNDGGACEGPRGSRA
jgi:cyclophilin family peptidyl-prolyl cis-trans isomerase